MRVDGPSHQSLQDDRQPPNPGVADGKDPKLFGQLSHAFKQRVLINDLNEALKKRDEEFARDLNTADMVSIEESRMEINNLIPLLETGKGSFLKRESSYANMFGEALIPIVAPDTNLHRYTLQPPSPTLHHRGN